MDQTTRIIDLGGQRALELPVLRFRVVVETGPDAGRVREISSTSAKIGSAPDNDLVLTDRSVSRHHALVLLTEKGLVVRDLKSRNGTTVRGMRVTEVEIPAGEAVTFGSTVCRVRLEEGPLVACPDEVPTFEGLLGGSQVMRDLFAVVRQVARTDLPVLVTGETGCGKDLIARAIHRAGPRSERPFVVLDCGSIVPELLRSELFGHEKGAFTGADRTNAGALESADGGTVFLDEVGEMSLTVQPNFLRALEGREIQRIGSKKSIPVDFRIVSATNRDLRTMAQEGRFRPDLLFRLSCVTLHLPPLRDRKEDVPLLAHSFALACAARNNLPAPALSSAVLGRLIAHSWPGNVRELRNVTETLTAMAGDGRIEPHQVDNILRHGGWAARAPASAAPPLVPVSSAPLAAPGPAAAPAVPTTLEDAERDVILRTLEATGWRRKEAARRLGISPTTLFAKLKRYNLRPPGE